MDWEIESLEENLSEDPDNGEDKLAQAKAVKENRKVVQMKIHTFGILLQRMNSSAMEELQRVQKSCVARHIKQSLLVDEKNTPRNWEKAKEHFSEH